MTLAEYTALVRKAVAQQDRGLFGPAELDQILLELAARLFGHVD